jgi:hypothetical protein
MRRVPPLIHFVYHNRRIRIRVRITLGAVVVIAGIVGGGWSRSIIDALLTAPSSSDMQPAPDPPPENILLPPA